MEELQKLEEERREGISENTLDQKYSRRRKKRRALAVARGGDSKCRDVYVFDFEYFFIAVDSDEYDCVPQSVWECESGWDCGTCDGGYDGEYGCGDSVL